MPVHDQDTLIGRLSYHVPDEICVVVDGKLNDDGYDAIQTSLNKALIALIDTFPSGTRPPEGDRAAGQQDLTPLEKIRLALAQDLEPAGFREYLRERGEGPLISKPRAERQTSELAGEKPTTLAFYKIAPPAGSKAIDLATSERTRELVNVLNFRILSRLRMAPEGSPPLVAITPHWLVGAMGEPSGCPSPGAVPVPLDETRDGKWSFEFTKISDPRLNELIIEGRAGRLLEGQKSAKVVVAVLDTCPASADIATAANQYTHNQLLRDVFNHSGSSDSAEIVIDTPGISLPQSDFNDIDDYGLNWMLNPAGEAVPPHTGLGDHSMKDHGLFITGIIRDIVPHAQIHLIRVLGGFGVSTLARVAPVLQQLGQRILAGHDGDPTDRRLVVSLSLGASLPPGEQALRIMLPTVFKELLPQLATSPDIESALTALGWDEGQDYLNTLRASTRAILDWIRKHPQVLVVAAAGNDNDHFKPIPSPALHRPKRPEPRWPAHDDAVLGVGALNLADQPTNYSNRGDVLQLGNGVAIWGGEAKPTNKSDLGVIEVESAILAGQEVDAIRGIYSEALVPILDKDGNVQQASNSSGWVYWAGTSFATPIIAGLAAAMWIAKPDLSSADIITRITGRNGTSPSLTNISKDSTGSGRLDCAGIEARQFFKP